VLISWPIIAPALTFYLPEDMDVVSFPEVTRTRMNRWDGMLTRLRDQRNLERLFERLSRTLTSGGKVWLVDGYHSYEWRDDKDDSLLQGLSYLDSETCREDQIRAWLQDHSQQVGTNRLAPGRDFSVFLSVYEPRNASKGIK